MQGPDDDATESIVVTRRVSRRDSRGPHRQRHENNTNLILNDIKSDCMLKLGAGHRGAGWRGGQVP